MPPPPPHRPPASTRNDGRGTKSVGRQAAVTACPPNPQPPNPPAGDGRYPVAWLTISAPGRGATPTAHSVCECGHDRFVIGHHRIPALAQLHAAHRDVCPLRNPQATQLTHEMRKPA